MRRYPDANSTMRLSYGQVCSLEPWDGVSCSWKSTLRGLVEKRDLSRHDFAYDDKFAAVLAGAEKGRIVNFLTDNDITGGNSGSPVLNARGELVGTTKQMYLADLKTLRKKLETVFV